MNAAAMQPAKPVKRTCMRDRIRDELVARILDGQYAPGTQLKELVLAREFNVSQAPIREALRELEGSGLVTSERYRGTRVRGADPEELRQSYEARQTIEIRAVELAIPVAPEVMARLDAELATMHAASAVEDVERYIDAAIGLHRQLVEASGNRVFLTVLDSLHYDIRGRIVLRRMAEQGSGFGSLLTRHGELLERIRRHDAAGAIEALRGIFSGIIQAVLVGRSNS
jgi:DNA-binding GntR family transcriptional regulator